MKKFILWAQKNDNDLTGAIYCSSDCLFDLIKKADDLSCHRSDYKHVIVYHVKNYGCYQEVQKIW